MPLFSFSHFRTLLAGLPLPASDNPSLDFCMNSPSPDGFENTESIKGAVNYDLEKLLGYKAHGLTLPESGPSHPS
jgi:hypothetical protein